MESSLLPQSLGTKDPKPPKEQQQYKLENDLERLEYLKVQPKCDTNRGAGSFKEVLSSKERELHETILLRLKPGKEAEKPSVNQLVTKRDSNLVGVAMTSNLGLDTLASNTRNFDAQILSLSHLKANLGYTREEGFIICSRLGVSGASMHISFLEMLGRDFPDYKARIVPRYQEPRIN
ncbi:hypothetical protein ACH5RR_021016 [Cinchona calisaya]|uniref:Uncharacterized protein n=1 Tax=Cinchona calisaya TaxID=153742 RepID=A0ABD2ZG41_9GENT